MTLAATLTPGSAHIERKSANGKVVTERLSDEAFLMALGKRVRTSREQRGLPRKVLAEWADISERYLAQLESGNGNASAIFLRRIASALNVRMTYLLGCDMSLQRSQLNSVIDSLAENRLEEAMCCLMKEFGADASLRRKRIALIGLRGAGKSTLGSELAKVMRRPFVDLHREIERAAGKTLAEVFLLHGPTGYRHLERQCIERMIASQNDIVMSVGGGVVSEPATYRLLLSNCFTVWLKASPAEHMSRVIAQGDVRPIRGQPQAMEDLKAILTARDPYYGKADAVVDTSGQTVMKSLAALRAVVIEPAV